MVPCQETCSTGKPQLPVISLKPIEKEACGGRFWQIAVADKGEVFSLLHLVYFVGFIMVS